jgi:threonine aldolase
MMNFASDNASGASMRVLAALAAANEGAQAAYGGDEYSKRAEAALSELFERDVFVQLVATGTAANALALAALTPPWGAVFCHAEAHIMDDECGAPEFFTDGAKLIGIPGLAGKITSHAFERALARFPRGQVKSVQPAVLSLSQVTEAGTIYNLMELLELTSSAHMAGMSVHMDGARFANALVALDCTPAEMTWKVGVDALSLGFTKNGALACEAIILFDPSRAQSLAFRRKRAGHTLSKGRLLGAQAMALIEDDHWLDLARHANGQAARLAAGLAAIPGIRLPWSVQANEVFPILPEAIDAALRAAGFVYHAWQSEALPIGQMPAAKERFVRLVTSFATDPEHVDDLIAVAKQTGLPGKNA